jgi:hypothetical protein
MWSSGYGAPGWALPFFWATQGVFYYAFYMSKMLERPVGEVR